MRHVASSISSIDSGSVALSYHVLQNHVAIIPPRLDCCNAGIVGTRNVVRSMYFDRVYLLVACFHAWPDHHPIWRLCMLKASSPRLIWEKRCHPFSFLTSFDFVFNSGLIELHSDPRFYLCASDVTKEQLSAFEKLIPEDNSQIAARSSVFLQLS